MAQSTVGDAIPWQVALGCIIEQAEQAMESKLASGILKWSLLQLLPLGPCLGFP